MPFEKPLEGLVRRVEWTAQASLSGFPHYADPTTGEWTTSPEGDWTGGFWVGLLWLAHQYTGEGRFRRWAVDWSERLRRRANSESIFRCFLFYYGAAIGEILAGDAFAKEVALQGAEGLSTLFNKAVGLIPLGIEAEEMSNVGRNQTNVDGVMATALLAWASDKTGNPKFRDIGIQHARKHIDFCLRDDGSVCQSANFDPETGRILKRYSHKGYSDKSTWSRAQAWAMLGYSLAARWIPEEDIFLRTAERVSDWWITHAPKDFVAFWDFDDPGIPHVERDTSATAIAAASLLKLSELSEDAARKKQYREVAEDTCQALVKDYLKETPDKGSILTRGCYSKKAGIAIANELIWGDYFLFEATLGLARKINPIGL